jgi:hypothetical protein
MKRNLLSTLACSVLLAITAFAACGPKAVETGSNGASSGGSSSNSGTSSSSSSGGNVSTDVLLGPVTATTLIVDNEWQSSVNDPNTTTPSYELFTGLATAAGINYDTIVDVTDGNPTYADLELFDTVIWFSAYTYGSGVGASVSAEQETILTNWLDLGGKTLFLYTSNLVYDHGGGDCNWSGPVTDVLLSQYVGATGGAADMKSDVNGDLNHSSYTLTGAAGFSGDSWSIAGNTPISDTADGINPAASVDVLATVQADPNCNSSGDLAVPVITGNKGVGLKGTSTVIFIGTTLEDITPLAYTNADIFNGLLTYAGE